MNQWDEKLIWLHLHLVVRNFIHAVTQVFIRIYALEFGIIEDDAVDLAAVNLKQSPMWGNDLYFGLFHRFLHQFSDSARLVWKQFQFLRREKHKSRFKSEIHLSNIHSFYYLLFQISVGICTRKKPFVLHLVDANVDLE